jgi:D-sedoheptulose 7-phosphate isomerase
MTRAEGRIVASIEESIAVKQAVLEELTDEIGTASEWIIDALAAGRKVLFFGNGGSAADAQHLAAELVGRFEQDGPALAAIALTTDTSILTSLANDFATEAVFARQVEAVGQPGDVVVAISTSGASPNVLAGVRTAREAAMRTIALTGADGQRLADSCDLALRVPSRRTARIQEAHITIGHVLCELVEESARR